MPKRSTDDEDTLLPDVMLRDPPGRDPALLGWPVQLPIEIALGTANIKETCEAYGITRDEWEELKNDPMFRAEVRAAKEELQKEGMTFLVKARLQSEELLKTSWKMIHDPGTPHAVRADLIKFIIKAAGLSQEKAAQAQVGNALQINIQL